MTTTTPSPDATAEVSAPTFWNRCGYWFPHIVILAYCGVVLGAMATQFFGHEMPCPLCMLQRMAMFLICISQLWIIGRVRNGTLTASAYSATFGFTLISTLLGAIMSTRQILLHIVPPDPGYGGVVLGLHLYTWALVTFFVVMVYVAIMSIFAPYMKPTLPQSSWARRISTVIIVFFMIVLIANLVSVFVEEGFNWVLPDNPTRYELLYQLGIK